MIAVLGVGSSSAAIVQNTVSVGTSGPLGPSPNIGTPNSSFGYATLNATTFQETIVLLGNAYAFFEVQENDPLTWYTVDLSEALVTNTNFAPRGQQFTIPNGGSILLGFWEDWDASGFDPQAPLITIGDNYGWVRIANNNGTLSAMASASAVAGAGILAGTLTAIPEPSVAIAGLLGIVPLFRRRR